MRDRLAAVLDKSLKSHGVQLTNKELVPVVDDLMVLLEPKKESAAPVAVELKPIPVKS